MYNSKCLKEMGVLKKIAPGKAPEAIAKGEVVMNTDTVITLINLAMLILMVVQTIDNHKK